jgi:hypothetical protein
VPTRIAEVEKRRCLFCGGLVLVDFERSEVLHENPLCPEWAAFAAKNPDSVLGKVEVDLPEGTQ